MCAQYVIIHRLISRRVTIKLILWLFHVKRMEKRSLSQKLSTSQLHIELTASTALKVTILQGIITIIMYCGTPLDSKKIKISVRKAGKHFNFRKEMIFLLGK